MPPPALPLCRTAELQRMQELRTVYAKDAKARDKEDCQGKVVCRVEVRVVADATTDLVRISVRAVGPRSRGMNQADRTIQVHPARARSYKLAAIHAGNWFR